jgi:hypothetical protein
MGCAKNRVSEKAGRMEDRKDVKARKTDRAVSDTT